jgi:hypothetical protein
MTEAEQLSPLASRIALAILLIGSFLSLRWQLYRAHRHSPFRKQSV